MINDVTYGFTNINGVNIELPKDVSADDMQDFQVIKRFAEAADWDEGSGVLNVKDINLDSVPFH